MAAIHTALYLGYLNSKAMLLKKMPRLQLPPHVPLIMSRQSQKSGVGASREVEEPRIPTEYPPLCRQSQKSGVGASREVEEPRILTEYPPLCGELQQSRREAVEGPRMCPDDPSSGDDSKKNKKPKTTANDSEKGEKPEKPKTPANDSEENEKPKTPARDDSNGDPPLRQPLQKSGVGSSGVVDQPRIRANHPPLDGIPQSGGGASKEDEKPKTRPVRAKLPMKGLMVLLAVIAIMLALLPVETLKSNPGTKATTVTVLYAFAFSVVIWLKLQQPRITKGYTLISICQFLIRLVFTAGFVCIACIVSVFIPDGLGWIVIYVSVNGTVSCILVAWDIASMFRAAVSAETHNA